MKVFLSFAWGDVFVARRIMSLLRQHNHTVDYDSTNAYFNSVRRAIIEADAVIVLWSRAAAATRRVLQEAQFAHQCNKPPVPVLLDPDLEPLDEGVWSGLLSKAVKLDFKHPDFFEDLIRLLEERHIRFRGCEEISYFPEREPPRGNGVPAQIIEAPRPYENRVPGIRPLLEAVVRETGINRGSLELFDEVIAKAQPIGEADAYRRSMCGRSAEFAEFSAVAGDERSDVVPVPIPPEAEPDSIGRDADGLRVERVAFHRPLIAWRQPQLIAANRNDRVDAMHDSLRQLQGQLRGREGAAALALTEEVERNALAVSQGAAAVACMAAAAVSVPVITHRQAEQTEGVMRLEARGGMGKAWVPMEIFSSPPTETRAGELAHFLSRIEWHFGALVPPRLVQEDVYAFLYKFKDAQNSYWETGTDIADRARSMCVMFVLQRETVRKRWLGDRRRAMRLLQNREWRDVVASAGPMIEDYLDVTALGAAPGIHGDLLPRSFAPPTEADTLSAFKQQLGAMAGSVTRWMARMHGAVSARLGPPAP